MRSAWCAPRKWQRKMDFPARWNPAACHTCHLRGVHHAGRTSAHFGLSGSTCDLCGVQHTDGVPIGAQLFAKLALPFAWCTPRRSHFGRIRTNKAQQLADHAACDLCGAHHADGVSSPLEPSMLPNLPFAWCTPRGSHFGTFRPQRLHVRSVRCSPHR